jgi:hypothetical protein
MLPDGWTIDRVRAVAQGTAELVSLDSQVVVDELTQSDEGLRARGTSPLSASCIIRFGDLYLVRDIEDDSWYLGRAETDGVIHCWAGYGDDLEQAIRAL